MTAIAAPRDCLLRAALSYATDHGLPVLPLHAPTEDGCTCQRGRGCRRPGKHPRIPRWVREASRDPEIIASWFERWPDANLGIRTGTSNGILAVDVDPPHGGDETLERLERQYGRLPETATVLTGGGGRHYFLRHPGGYIPSTADTLGSGIDVRADGGLIVAPPSVHRTGREYIWHPNYGLDSSGIATMPDWLEDLLVSARRASRAGRSPARPTAGARAGFRWETVLDGVDEGRRHISIFLMVSGLRGQGTPKVVAETLALRAARACRPPFPEDEALAIVADVFARYAPNETKRPGLSEERMDILAVLATAPRPLQPARVARALGRPREPVKKLLCCMYADRQVGRVEGGYVPRVRAVSDEASQLVVSEGAFGDDAAWFDVEEP